VAGGGVMANIDLNEIYPPIKIKVEPGPEWVNVILTKDHPDVGELVAHFSPYDDQIYIGFAEGSRPLAFDVEEVEGALMAFIQAIFEPRTVSLLEQGILAMGANSISRGMNERLL